VRTDGGSKLVMGLAGGFACWLAGWQVDVSMLWREREKLAGFYVGLLAWQRLAR
jgi:hypothetical protein